MAETTDRYALSLLQAGQAQKEVTHNEAVAAIDALLHLAVESRIVNIVPTAPVAGTAWIIGAAPLGDWSGRAGMIATFSVAGWAYAVPRDGCLAYVKTEEIFIFFATGVWHGEGWPIKSLKIGARIVLGAEPVTISGVGGGAVVDVQARAAVDAILNTLRAAGLVTSV